MGERLVGETGAYFEDWLDSNVDPETARLYRYYFNKFTNWLSMDTEELYKKHRDNLKSDEPIKRLWLSKKITEYMKCMRDKLGYSTEDERGNVFATRTVLIVPTAVVAFFKSVGIEEIAGSTTIPVLIEEIPKATKEQLRKMVDASGSYKTKSYIIFAKDSGLRTGDITNLPIGIVGDALTKINSLVKDISLIEAIEDPNIEYFTFEWKQQKTGRLANPAIGPESFDMLKEWIRYRTEKQRLSINNEEPLFCIERTRKRYTTKRGREVKAIKAGDWMDESNMGVIFQQLRDKAGLKDTGISIHSCRKTHKTNLEAKEVPTSWVNKMQGRKGVGTGGVYTKPEPKQLLIMYKKGYDGLRIYKIEKTAKIEHAKTLATVAREMGVDEKTVQKMMELFDAGKMTLDEFRKRVSEKIDEARKRLSEKTKEKSENNVMVIKEDELENHLNHGWTFKAVLPSGRILIER